MQWKIIYAVFLYIMEEIRNIFQVQHQIAEVSKMRCINLTAKPVVVKNDNEVFKYVWTRFLSKTEHTSYKCGMYTECGFYNGMHLSMMIKSMDVGG